MVCKINAFCTPIKMNKITSIVLPYMSLLFCIGIITTTILSLIPGSAVPNAFQFWDKAQHTLAFLMLAMTGGLAFPKKSNQVFMGLIIYGALIEIMQSTLTTTRFGNVLDWVADGVGVFIGIAVYVKLTKMQS